MDLQELDQLENSFIEDFRNHAIFKHLSKLSNEQFFSILKQRRFLSLAFAPVYDAAIDGLVHPEALDVARKLLREEYPPRSPSHREELIYDLVILGIPKQEILNEVPTLETLEVIRKTFLLLRFTESQELYDIRAVAALRFWGEVLVAEEYNQLTKRMVSMGLTVNNSRFFWPHYKHDLKRESLTVLVNLNSHSDQLTKVLQQLLNSEAKIQVCAQTTKQVYDMKSSFYDQFERFLV